jgi:septal ring factor EnvC (AmiA/AmiB activator)
MKAFKQTVMLLMVNIALIGLAGCGIDKEEHEKVVSQLEEANALLAKTRAELEQANTKIANMKVLQPDDQQALKTALKKHKRARRLLRASLADSQRETTILRQQLDELTQSLMKVSRERDVTKQANEVLKRQIDELMRDKRRSQELTEEKR